MEGRGGVGEGGEICSLRFWSGWEEPRERDRERESGLSGRGADGEISSSELISLQRDGWLLVMKTKWRIRLISGILNTALNCLLIPGSIFSLTSDESTLF